MFTKSYIIERLEDAGATLMRSPDLIKPAGYKSNWPDVIPDYYDADEKPRWALPTSGQITRLDEVLDWMFKIENTLQRSVVLARSLTHPIERRPMYSWRRLAKQIDVSATGIKRHYDRGIDHLLQALNSTG